jgi:hypothetical protein
VYRHFIELEAVPQSRLDLVGDPVGTGDVSSSINRDGELGKAPVAGAS